MTDADQRPADGRIDFDFSRLRFIEADGVVSLTNAIEWLRRQGVEVAFLNHTIPSEANRYLDSFGFFEVCVGEQIFPNSFQRGTTMSLKRLHHAESHAWVDLNMIPWMAGNLSLPEASFVNIKTCFQEIFNNIIDHSGEEIGCVHLQRHPNINIIRAAISDFGIGVPNAMRSVYPTLTDPEALKLATQEGVTSKHGRNRGAGLDVLMKNVVGLNQGTVEVRSCKGICRSDLHGDCIRVRAWGSWGFYPGTLFDIIFRTDTIAREGNGREEFTWF